MSALGNQGGTHGRRAGQEQQQLALHVAGQTVSFAQSTADDAGDVTQRSVASRKTQLFIERVVLVKLAHQQGLRQWHPPDPLALVAQQRHEGTHVHGTRQVIFGAEVADFVHQFQHDQAHQSTIDKRPGQQPEQGVRHTQQESCLRMGVGCATHTQDDPHRMPHTNKPQQRGA